MKWHNFDPNKGWRQKRPRPRKPVLVQIRNDNPGLPDPIMVGYMKNAAGDKSHPYFIVPGKPRSLGQVYRWQDCLGISFEWPEQ